VKANPLVWCDLFLGFLWVGLGLLGSAAKNRELTGSKVFTFVGYAKAAILSANTPWS